ncbi:MAG: drug resistance transporter, Bcr/CflA subfamily [Rhodopila sp.]|nr:drug resistance transporter, Bcr/CflA subfamily [Rhodopila sp.]
MRIAPESVAFTILLGVLAALPALSIDISAPTLVLLPRALQTSSYVAGLTLSLFMGGFALGQLVGGRSSDRAGRRPILLTGLVSYSVASVACALSPTGFALVISRLGQGVGAGACSVLSFAMVQDLFEGEAARTKRSYVTVIFGVVPMLAPALGSWLSGLAGWRAIYGLLALAGSCLSVVTWHGVAESRGTRLKTSAPADAAVKVRLRDDPEFVGLTLANAFSYGGIFAYIAGSPIVIIGHMKLSSTVFVAVFASTAAALTAGAWVSARLSRQGFRASVVLDASLGIAAAATLTLAAACLAGVTSGVILVPLLLVVMFARGTIAPNFQHLAIERRREQAGAASAAVGVSQLLSGALASAAVAVLLPAYGATAVAAPMALLAVAALVQWHWIKRNVRA